LFEEVKTSSPLASNSHFPTLLSVLYVPSPAKVASTVAFPSAAFLSCKVILKVTELTASVPRRGAISAGNCGQWILLSQHHNVLSFAQSFHHDPKPSAQSNGSPSFISTGSPPADDRAAAAAKQVALRRVRFGMAADRQSLSWTPAEAK